MLLEDLFVNCKFNNDMVGMKALEDGLKKIIAYAQIISRKTELGLDADEAINAVTELQKKLTTLNELQGKIKLTSETEASWERLLAKTQQVLKTTQQINREANRVANLKANSFEGRNYGFKSAANATDMFREKLNRVNPIVAELKSKLGALGALAGVGFSFQQYISVSDQWKTISAQIKNVTKGSEEAASAQKELYNIASRTRQSYSETAGLFTSVSRNASELGKDTGEILKFTEDVSNAMLLGGGNAASQQAALVQLGQALGSGTLRGDELNSIMEQAPRLAQVIAKGMGTTIGNLRNLGAQGKITAQDVFKAVRSQSEQLKGELGNMPWTVQQASIKAQNAMGMLFYTIEQKTGIGSTVAEGIAKVATVLERINNILADMPVENIYSWLKLIAITVGVIYAAVKRSAIIYGLQTIISLLGITSIGFNGAAAAAGVFKAASIRASMAAAASWLAAAWPIAAIVAGILLLILIINDLYVWINGGDSIMGRMFGSWGKFVEGMKKKWKELCEACAEWIKKGFIDCLRDVYDWIVKILKVMSPLYWMYRGLAFLGIGDKVTPLIDTKQYKTPWIDGIRNVNWEKDVLHGGPGVVAEDYSGALGRYSGINNANQNNYNTVNIYGGTPDEVAQKTTDAVFNPKGFEPFAWGR